MHFARRPTSHVFARSSRHVHPGVPSCSRYSSNTLHGVPIGNRNRARACLLDGEMESKMSSRNKTITPSIFSTSGGLHSVSHGINRLSACRNLTDSTWQGAERKKHVEGRVKPQRAEPSKNQARAEQTSSAHAPVDFRSHTGVGRTEAKRNKERNGTPHTVTSSGRAPTRCHPGCSSCRRRSTAAASPLDQGSVSSAAHTHRR